MQAMKAIRHALAWVAAVVVGMTATPTTATAQLTVRVSPLPRGTPPGAMVFIAGDFNRWNPGDTTWALRPTADGALALTFPATTRGPIAFKFTRGSWTTVETSADGSDIPNRSVVIPQAGDTTYTTSIAAWKSSHGPSPARSTARPSVRVLSDSFAIPSLGRSRRVWIYLPPGYDRGTERYPVVYLQDGQNVFDAATSFAGEWGVDETLDSLAAHGVAGAIVVAVDNGGALRMNEYNPWTNASPRLGGGDGDAFVDFLARTLKPYIDKQYRTRPDARSTTIVGSSMGGLIALYASLTRPDVFGNAGVFSCACWIARDSIMALVQRTPPGRPSARFYFVVGSQEGRNREPEQDQISIVAALNNAGFRTGSAVIARVAADGGHEEWFWRREFPAAYLWLTGAGGR